MVGWRMMLVFLLLAVASISTEARSARLATSWSKTAAVETSNWIQKVTHSVKGAAFALLIACSVITGCERGELRPLADVLGARDPEALEVIYMQDLVIYVGGADEDNIVINGEEYKEYQGVLGMAENGQMVAQIFTGGGALTFLQLTDATTGLDLDKHEHIGERVYLAGARGVRAVRKSGIVTKVFNNGYYMVDIDSERYVSDGSEIALLTPYNMLVYELFLQKEDGSSFIGIEYED